MSPKREKKRERRKLGETWARRKLKELRFILELLFIRKCGLDLLNLCNHFQRFNKKKLQIKRSEKCHAEMRLICISGKQ